MNERADREVTVLNAALDLPVGRRVAYLDLACAGDANLRQRVEALLRASKEAGTFLENPTPGADSLPGAPAPAGSAGTLVTRSSPTEQAGDRIGRYKLLQQIGEGGCGVVYMAEQEEPVRRRVALKIIKLGMDTKEVIARFEAERQALALMDHPNIAKVLDAGATETGRPYFVMELVRGIKITDYCDQNNLSTRERLGLFVQVCQAVQHAHQKGIIHRDIKPSNILMTLNDGVPMPKVIDFGIAKATTDQRLTDKTVFTALEQFIGTPAYMSPEQAEMSALDIDTRSDIYALGVLLYELLTGKTPFDPKELLTVGLDEMRRTIREKEPPRPSTRLHTMLDADLTSVARHRRADPARLTRMVRGDLDWIAMKAMEKDRTRRYETANGLAMDVRRYLADEPIVARPPSKWYRLRKTAGRNKVAFVAAAAIACALVLGALVSAWQAARASRAEWRAGRERDRALTINRFLTEDLLYQATPEQTAREKNVTMEQVLAKATRKLDQDRAIAAQPEVEATLRLALGSTYLKLSSLGEAKRNLRRALSLRQSVLGPRHLDTLAVENELGRLLVEGTRDFDEGEKVTGETFHAREQLLGAENTNTLDSMSLYVEALMSQRKVAEAEQLARRCLELHERILGPYNYQTISALNNLGMLLTDEGRYAQAEENVRDQIARFQSVGLGECDDAMWAVNNLAWCLLLQGHAAEAETMIKEALPRAIRNFGAETLIPLHLQRVLARILDEEGHLDEAEARARAILTAHLRDMPEHESTGRLRFLLGRVLVEEGQEGKADEAKAQLQAALDLFQKRYSKKPELAAQAENWLGAIELNQGNYVPAESLMLPNSKQFLVSVVDMTAKERRAILGNLIRLYQSWGKPEAAAAWRKNLDDLEKATPGQKQ